MDDFRPDPDSLLAAIQKDEARQHRGKLKIFFGMAAGVGKTYTMLQAAHERKAEGVDVVVGYIETHKRAETEGLIEGLEVIPRQKVEYRGTFLEEMDLDTILKRDPDLALVDELAHTNAPGVRHTKRYQDIFELLEAGIDVYTTVNVQHFESRTDAVRQITGITVHETIPDSLLDQADEIELIDLSPEDLRKRLAEGKVYTPERVETAANNFFRVGNLTALREMALRLTAERVDHQLQDYMAVKQIAGPWKSTERLMVAISASPFSERLIRWTRRMAYNLEAPWIVVYIETSSAPSPESKEMLARHLKTAQELGGEVVVTAGTDICHSLLHVARQRNVTQIVIGKPLRTSVQEFLSGGSLVNKLIRQSGDIDVYVITGDEEEAEPRSRTFQLPQLVTHSGLKDYVLAITIIVIVTIANLLVQPLIDYQATGLTELFAVLLIAIYIGRGPALVAATISALSWNYLFIEPELTFQISTLQDTLLFFLYFAIAILSGNVTARLRMQERQARYNADRSMALYTLTRETAAAVNMDAVLRTAIEQLGRVFDAEVAILLCEQEELCRSPHPNGTLPIDDKEFAVAAWVYNNSKPAGRFTNTLSLASAQYFPLIASNEVVGVIGIRTRGHERLSVDEQVLLDTFINQVALVIERELIDEQTEQAAMLNESERLYTTLLNSISHELRTPIAAIIGAASNLQTSDPTARDQLSDDIQSSAQRLNRLVENLLDMSRLDSGRLQLKREWCDIGELIGVAIQRLQPCLKHRQLKLTIAPGLPLVQIDFVLMEQVLVNLLDNACSYTPPDAAISVQADQGRGEVVIRVSDTGPGIPSAELARVFDKFYRVPGTTPGGTGLGLSIAKSLVEAHGGAIRAETPRTGGTSIVITLPAIATPPPVKEVSDA